MTPDALRPHPRPQIRRFAMLLSVFTLLSAMVVGTVLPQPDEWQRLIESGDALAAGRRTPVVGPAGLSARAAYLLAFHNAQDAADVRRMLAAADRLARLGERDLAHWARHVSRQVAASPATPAKTPGD